MTADDKQPERAFVDALANMEMNISRQLTVDERRAFKVGFYAGASYGCEIAKSIVQEMK